MHGIGDEKADKGATEILSNAFLIFPVYLCTATAFVQLARIYRVIVYT